MRSIRVIAFSNLGARLAILILAAVLPAFALMAYSAREQREILAAQVQDNALQRARLASNVQDRLIEGARQLLISLAQRPEMHASASVCDRVLADLLARYPEYANLGVISLDGRVACSSVPVPPGINVADRLYFRRAVETQGFAVGEFQIGRVTGKATINFGYPVREPGTGRIYRVIFAALDLAWLNRLAAASGLPDGSTLTVYDHRGIVLARYPDPERWIGKPAPETSVVRTILARGEGTADARGLDGIPRLYGFTPLTGAPAGGAVYVSVGIPKAAAFADVDRITRWSLLGLGLAAAAAVLVGVVGARLLILRPTQALVRTAERLKAGDFGARAQLTTGIGELGRLGHAFDGMAQALQEREAERDRAENDLRRLNLELERRVDERTAELDAANKELEAFAYSVSHDLRAPLRALDGFSQILLQDHAASLDEAGRTYLGRIRAAAQRMGGLIDDLLKLSRVTRAELRREPVDLSIMARAIAADLARTNPQRTVKVVIADGARAEGDADLLRIVLENLLGNAWKFTGQRDEPRIEFGVAERDGERVFYVRDNGVGFDMAYAGKLFGAFQRLHSAQEFPGSGIGLATVQRIVHRHGGRIWTEGEVGEGACFYFTLPHAGSGRPTREDRHGA